MTAPFYLLVVTYTVVNLILHATELFIETVNSYLTISLVARNPAVLL
jgi:hypothetical protein